MFASFAVSLNDGTSLNGPGLSLSMRLKRDEGNQLRVELESSAALTSCECRINEPEIRRLTHSMLPEVLKPSSASTVSSQITSSVYLSPKPLQLYVSRPSADSEPPEQAFISPSIVVQQSSCEPELSSVSKLAAVSSTNELSKCFQSVANSRLQPSVPPPLQNQQASPLPLPTSSKSSESSELNDNVNGTSSSSCISSNMQSRSRSVSLPLTGLQTNPRPEQNQTSTNQKDIGSDTSDSTDSDNNTSSAVSALLQRAAMPYAGPKKLDVKQGIDFKKQREKLSQASSLPLEALMSTDFMSAAVSIAKQNP